MRGNESELDTETEILSFEVSDAEAERAGGTSVAAFYTIGNCTGLESCPA
jgi:hypothetical protein